MWYYHNVNKKVVTLQSKKKHIEYTLGWFKKTRFWGNKLLFHFLNLYVEKNSREGCDFHDDIQYCLNDDKFIPQ